MSVYFLFPLPFCPCFFSPLSPVRLFERRFPLLSVHPSHLLFLQATETDFSNVGTMIECGLFTEALDSIRSTVYPGLLPPAAYLVSLLHYAQQVGLENLDWKITPPVLRKPGGLH